jgi:PAP2 superfamily
MRRSRPRRMVLVLALLLVTGGIVTRARPSHRTFREVWGRLFEKSPDPQPALLKHRPSRGADTAGRLRHWNRIAIDSSGLDHTPVEPGDSRVFGEQLGPGRSSRAMAIVHIAIFEAMNAIDGRFQSYLDIPQARRGVSMDAAIAQAAHDTLVALFPSQKAQCDQLLAADLATMPDGTAKRNGVLLGRAVAAGILLKMRNDGSNHPEPLYGVDYIAGNGPGEWRQDPISRLPPALGARWGSVRPFVAPSGRAFRAPPPPPLWSPAYATAFNEVKRLGGDDITTRTVRTDDQTLAGIYWAYDGTPSLCAPPRLYNQITEVIATQMGSDVAEQARLFALVNVAMADAGIAIWESKFFYKLWRPVTGIREADRGTGPTGIGDRNPLTRGDATFSPLGAPASNLDAPNFTPPFPAYPSGHAGFGGALFQILRKFYGRDDIPFTFVSDELNGVTVDNEGVVRPLMPRSFKSLSQAEEENGQSRIYLGIHWSFDKTAGIAQGRRVADYVFANAFRPLR